MKPTDVQYYVEIVEYKTRDVIKRMGPMSERRADRVDGGVSINLNHEKFFTRVVEEQPFPTGLAALEAAESEE